MTGGLTPLSDPNKNLYNGGSEWQIDFGDLPDLMQTYYRNYDQALGRWIGIDPDAEGAESLTTYNYSGNNPVMFNDPLGNKFDSIDELLKTIESLWNNTEFGGWSEGYGGSMGVFSSSTEAFQAGSDYAYDFNLWGTNGYAKDLQSAVSTYNKSLPNGVPAINMSDMSMRLPQVSYNDLNNGKYPDWWGKSQLFLDANKSYSGETQIATNDNSGFSFGKAEDWADAKSKIKNALKINDLLDKAYTVAMGSKKYLEYKKIAKFTTSKLAQRIGKVTGVTTLLTNSYKAVGAFNRGDKRATIKYGFLAVGQGVTMLLGPEFELAWNLADLTVGVFTDDN